MAYAMCGRRRVTCANLSRHMPSPSPHHTSFLPGPCAVPLVTADGRKVVQLAALEIERPTVEQLVGCLVDAEAVCSFFIRTA